MVGPNKLVINDDEKSYNQIINVSRTFFYDLNLRLRNSGKCDKYSFNNLLVHTRKCKISVQAPYEYRG